jgi:hypothetical protein
VSSKITTVEQLRPVGSARPRRSTFWSLALLVLMVGVAALGSFVGLRQLDTAIAAENRGRLDIAKGVFELLRTRALEDMRELGRILADDTRLRRALATEDKATVADSLADLGKLRGSGMFVVLTPEGRVFAEAGAPELRGLDLSASSVVKKAQSSNDVVGSWVIGNKIIDISLTPIQADNAVIAYLVVGQTVDQALLKPIGAATGVTAGIAIGTEWTVVSDDRIRAMTALAQNPAGQIPPFELDGTRYVASVVELDQMGQSRPRLVLVQTLAPTGATFSIFRWLLWLSPLLVLIGMVLAISRSNYRAP